MSKIRAHAIIEILGTPKEHVEEVLQKVMEKIEKDDNGIKILNGKAYEAEKVKAMWTAFSEGELEFDDLNVLFGFCFDYMPSSIDILEPDKLEVDTKTVNDLVNDLLAKLHQYDMIAKNMSIETAVLRRELEKHGIKLEDKKPKDKKETK